MKNVFLSMVLMLALLFSGQAQAATATALVTAKVYLPINLSVVDNGKFVFNRTSTDPAWTGTTSLDTTNTVYPKVLVGGEPSSAITITVPAMSWVDGSSNTILSADSLVKCSTGATGTFPSSSCLALSTGGSTYIWIATKAGTTNHAANVVRNIAGRYTTAVTVQVDY